MRREKLSKGQTPYPYVGNRGREYHNPFRRHDTKGGPFVSYTTVDTATGRVLTIDCYVYSPKNHKRNYVRGVEHLLYLLKFPEQPRQ